MRVFTKLLKPILAMLRHQGVRLVMYLDDILIMSQSREELMKHLSMITSLLELLGFVVNREKCQLIPTQLIQYLGFMVDSREMKIRLSEEKATQIATACRRTRQRGSVSVRDLARLIGKMIAMLPGIFPAPLWYREEPGIPELPVIRDLSGTEPGGHSGIGPVVNQEELNGGKEQEPDLTMETDASMLGWGAVCRGLRTGGLWSQVECMNYINYLELLAAMFAVKAFAKDKRNILKMDNKTALFYVNRMGGTCSPVLSRLAIQLWQWCLERNLSITAEHLPGVDNCVADEESRMIQSTAEWQLHQTIFQQILTTLGSCNMDLFATRHNTQFVSWRPDPEAVPSSSPGPIGKAMPSYPSAWSADVSRSGRTRPPWYLRHKFGDHSHGTQHY